MPANRRRRAVPLTVLAVAALVLPLGTFAGRAVSERPGARAATRLLDAAPLAFEPNQGQFDPAVRFVAHAGEHDVRLTANGLQLPPATSSAEPVAITLDGSRVDVQARGERPLERRVNRLVGEDPTRWRTGLPTYEAVTYAGIYPGVDLVFYGRGRQVEHDFVVAPGVDPSVIRLALSGVTRPRIAGNGDLVLPSPAGDVRLLAPRLHQDVGGRRRAVAGGYRVRPDGRVGFAVGPYDRSRPLVIDPVVVSASYLGGSSTDTAYSAAVDVDGNIVVTGYTESSDFPTQNPAQTALAQDEATRTDVFVTKIKADGGTVLWSTYLGGRGRDAAFAATVGGDGSVYVTGYSESADFPVVKPIQNSNAGGASDAFVTKLNSLGSAIEYSTFLGGKGADSGSGIAVDAGGAVYVVGATGSADFPLARAFQGGLSRPDDVDAFVAKLDPGGTLAYSSYLGGGGDDHALDVAVDGEGSVYVVGDTKSANFPVARPFQSSPGAAGTGVGANFADAFVAKVKADGSGLSYSTYLGGADSDKGTGVAVDTQGAAYVTGNTGSSNFPVENAFQKKKDGDFDAFVAKLKPDGAGLAYSTYLGGSGSDGGEAVTVDGRGHALVVGATASTNFPTARAFQGAKGGGFVDAFLTELNPSGNALVASSYLGGRDDDQAAGVAITSDGNAVVAGYTNSGDFPTAKPFQPGKGGGVGDAFVVKVRAESPGEATATAPAASKREERVRLLITITGGLFIAAIIQTIWLRRRPEPQQPRPSAPPAKPEEPALPGLRYTPRRGPLEARTVDGRPFAEPTGAVGGPVEERREEEPVGAGDGDGEDEVWGPERVKPRLPEVAAWEAQERPVLRPLERPPEPAGTPRLPVPDLWGSDAPIADASAAVRGRRPGRDTGSEVPEPDRWPTEPREGGGAGDLDPVDLWGPLAELTDPAEWADEWGVSGLLESPPSAPALPEPPAAAPPRRPEPSTPPTAEPVASTAPAATAPEPTAAAPEERVEAEPTEREPAEAAATAVEEPMPEPPAPPPPPEPEPEAAAPPPEPEPEPEPEPAAARSPGEISLSELLDEDLPIPEPRPAGDGAEREQGWISDILDEEFPIPEPASAKPGAPPADPSGLAAPTEPGTAAAEAAEAAAPPSNEPPPDDVLPPPPPRLLVNLFEPDPDDPLVQATRSLERRPPPEDGEPEA